MVRTTEERTTSDVDSDDHTTSKIAFSRQNSYKRRNSCDSDQETFDDGCNKRGCATTNRWTECPLAGLGCVDKLSYDSLSEHYSSQRHQEILMKAIEIYVKELHRKPNNGVDFDRKLNNIDYDELLSSINMLAEGLSCLNDDNLELHNKLVQLTNCILEQQKHFEQLKTSVQETTQLLHAVQMNNSILQSDIETMQQKVAESTSLLSNDGSYIWKITNVSEKMANALSDRQTSIYSPPFFSSPTGYKMCMRLYLNGDGQARNTHISLFFVLMRGEYDPILVWPFQHKITFILYDQTGAQRHIIDSFRPDIKSNSFQRPRSNMNIASGLPKFLPSSIIKQDDNPYLREDCMFIRCMVDFGAIPKTCLPYVASLNPGLPSAVQQSAIQAEIQKQRGEVVKDDNVVDNTKKIDELKVNK